MKNNTIIIFLFLSCVVFGQTPATSPGSWQLIFEDNFNGTEINEDTWKKLWDWGHGDWLACITTDGNNSNVQGGVIELIAKDQPYVGTVSYWDEHGNLIEYEKTFDYTRAMLLSRKKYKYGYFEIRCKLPYIPPGKTGRGIGPNFWMFDSDVDAGAYWSEIDVYEIDGEANRHTGNVHYREFEHSDHISGMMDFGNLDTRYHKYGVSWSPEEIKFYLDDVYIGSYNNHPSDLVKMPLIVNMGVPTTNFGKEIHENTLFPYVYTIDYVKVYKKKLDIRYETIDLGESEDFFASYSIDAEDVLVKGNGSTGGNLSLKAGYKIVLKEDVIVNHGGRLIAKIENTEFGENQSFKSSESLGEDMRIFESRKELRESAPDNMGNAVDNPGYLYPNPTQGLLYIDNIVIKDVEVYDLNARKVLVDYGSSYVDVSGLNQGFYFIKIHHVNGTITEKFFKL